MAKATYDCPNCGSAITVSDRSRKLADRRAAYLESRGDICNDCQRIERAAEAEQAGKDAAEAGLPALAGSEAQIAWAELLRAADLRLVESITPIVEAVGSLDELTGLDPDTKAARQALALEARDRIADTLLRSTVEHIAPTALRAIANKQRWHAFVGIMRACSSARWWIDWAMARAGWSRCIGTHVRG